MGSSAAISEGLVGGMIVLVHLIPDSGDTAMAYFVDTSKVKNKKIVKMLTGGSGPKVNITGADADYYYEWGEGTGNNAEVNPPCLAERICVIWTD